MRAGNQGKKREVVKKKLEVLKKYFSLERQKSLSYKNPVKGYICYKLTEEE